MLDKKTEAYLSYLRTLLERKFTGKITINCFEGGVAGITKAFEPKVLVEESVKLK